MSFCPRCGYFFPSATDSTDTTTTTVTRVCTACYHAIQQTRASETNRADPVVIIKEKEARRA
jgi:DNA-directed RNA polymerase subunit M/transcription elongation factor TFIIS